MRKEEELRQRLSASLKKADQIAEELRKKASGSAEKNIVLCFKVGKERAWAEALAWALGED